ALARLLEDARARERRRPAFAALAGELSWDRCVEPLARFLAAPRRAADRPPAVDRAAAPHGPGDAPARRHDPPSLRRRLFAALRMAGTPRP
ncbi:MAG TPA: hypothetical protein VG370_27515, partial [Chloroflexota bacterium]|nr:hypothetical protein [Chloroflexota bacterium]